MQEVTLKLATLDDAASEYSLEKTDSAVVKPVALCILAHCIYWCGICHRKVVVSAVAVTVGVSRPGVITAISRID